MKMVSVLIVLILLHSVPVLAGISATGDVSPTSPSTWLHDVTGYVGKTDTGSITVTGGSTLRDYRCILGNNYGSTGTVTVGGKNVLLDIILK